MNKQMKTMLMAAAVSGLVGGTAARLEAASAPTTAPAAMTSVHAAAKTSAGKISVARVGFDDSAKHSCKGKNDCKGQGGCKTGDNGCKGKNSCKGKGGCATDGSKAPQLG